ncbi:ribonuclease HII [Deferribacter autotrophicus]|uniref:Ribonuclease HII n=1 Tax=Deferribacter autotrophicus TaxID=500465 RepID=A0A5A8F3X6_9BACT|nr:ribonuclease HII [Deferribacter autotrophicus]KAA0258667.1 ribonuclease HII [Deferribacter autotrophicus]
MRKEIYVGVDEVGRGAFAGPVVVCAAVLPPDFHDERVIDSKKITEKNREKLAKYIQEVAIDYSYGVVCNNLIDKVNILQATKQAMHIALNKLKVKYKFIAVDSVKLKNIYGCEIVSVDKGESIFQNIAAASILAKVYRDALMKRLHLYFPEYNWYKNKGYGTKEHIEAIKKYGITYLHRKSFLKSYV